MSTQYAQQKRSIDTLRKNFEDIVAAADELADALEDGTADAELVAATYRDMAALSVAIEDAAEPVIDDEEPRWRAIDDLRAGIYHAAHAIELDGRGERLISPTPERARNQAITEATSAAEYLELARDEEDSDE